MDGLMIKSEPLTADQAKNLLDLVNQSPIPRGSMAIAVVQLLVALERLADGRDRVVPVEAVTG